MTPAGLLNRQAYLTRDLLDVAGSISGRGKLSPLISDACEKSGQWLWNEKLSQYRCQKARKQACVTDHHDMTLAVKMTLNSNTNKRTNIQTEVLKNFLCSKPKILGV